MPKPTSSCPPVPGALQWTGFGFPDPDGVQFPVMIAGIKHAAAVNGWSLDNTWIWADFSCVLLCALPLITSRRCDARQSAVC